jgi:hypothetical protein
MTKAYKLFFHLELLGGWGGIRLVIVWGGASHAPCTIHHTAHRLSQLTRHQDGRTGARPANQDGRHRFGHAVRCHLAFNIGYRTLHTDCNKRNLMQIIVVVLTVLDLELGLMARDYFFLIISNDTWY